MWDGHLACAGFQPAPQIKSDCYTLLKAETVLGAIFSKSKIKNLKYISGRLQKYRLHKALEVLPLPNALALTC